MTLNILGDKYSRQIEFIETTNQIAVGYSSGMVVFYDINDPKNPFYSRKIHNSEITSLQYNALSDEIITSSKDQNIKFFIMNLSEEKKALK